MHSTADWIKSAAPRDSVIAICRNVLTFRAEFLPNTHTRAYLVRHVHLSPLIKTIGGVTKSIEIAIFRFDRSDIQSALERAVAPGISVHALIATTNRGEKRPAQTRNGLSSCWDRGLAHCGRFAALSL